LGLKTPFCLWVENVFKRAANAGKNSFQMFHGYVVHLTCHEISNKAHFDTWHRVKILLKMEHFNIMIHSTYRPVWRRVRISPP
jgi:hypothetical protein